MYGRRRWICVFAGAAAGALLFAPEGRPSGFPGVVLNEVMVRPESGGSEWVELWNVSGKAVQLCGWTLSDSRRTPSLITSDSDLLEPDGYRVLVANEETFLRQFPRVELHRVREIEGSWPVLNNSQSDDGCYADMVILADAGGCVVDSLAYGEDWGLPGFSLERLSPDVGPLAANWCASLAPEGATPGARNSVHLERAPDASLVAAPDPFQPELHRVTFVSFRISLPLPSIRLQVFDVTGRLVRTLLDDREAGRSGRMAWDGLDERGEPAPTGIYILYLQAVDVAAGATFEARGTVTVARGF